MLIEQVEEACRSGVEKLIVAGGDGTVSSAIQGVMESDGLRPNLKILPLGTGNDFARSLGINPDPEIACREWKASQCRAVDVVRFTNSEETRWYANMLTGGNTGLYMDHMTEEIKQRWGPFCYLRGVIDVLKNLEVFQMTVEMEGQRTFSCKALNVFLANGGNSGGGLTVSPHAQVDDGLIDLVLVREGEPEKLPNSHLIISSLIS